LKLERRHCEERSDEAIHSFFARLHGLLRFARNDGLRIGCLKIGSKKCDRRSCATPHSSSPGLTGRSSIPEASVIEPRSRGVLVASFRGGSQSRTRNLEIPSDHPGMTTTGFVEVVRKRSSLLTIFWHCGFTHFSSRTGLGARARQQTVNGFGRGSASKGSGNADSQLFIRSSGWSGQCRPPGDSGCVAAHPAYRRAASYLPLRAGWAVCAWALRGCFEIARPFRAQTIAHH